MLFDDDIADRHTEDWLAAVRAPLTQEGLPDGLALLGEPERVRILGIGGRRRLESPALRLRQIQSDVAEAHGAPARRALHARALKELPDLAVLRRFRVDGKAEQILTAIAGVEEQKGRAHHLLRLGEVARRLEFPTGEV